ncbi:DUF2188 domain-containing protein [Miltoncostaea marina]|uniref:DUF2188 domain-containing protein n=1 Tax=Miltoncostaea marina TaxID=2843215 RepID=UPI001C3D9914
MARGNDNDRYVQPRPDGGWEVVKEHHERASAVTSTQREAIDRARQIVQGAGGGELRIKGRDGRFRDSDTIPPGRESPARDTK